jgi:uncharacterized BrkB/YihY/UPF0761 family membrane protein
MEPKSTNGNEKKRKQTRPVLLLWIIPLLLLIVLTGITVLGVCLLEQSDSSLTSQLKGLGVLVVIIAVISLLIGTLCLYSSARYVQLPAWRWIASGFKGEPNVPWIKKSKKPEAKYKMNKRQQACVWLGRICSVVGVILIIIGVVWRWIFTLGGDSFVGSITTYVFWVGAITFFAGLCIIKIDIPTGHHNGTKEDKGQS